jgi:hypothetical protein
MPRIVAEEIDHGVAHAGVVIAIAIHLDDPGSPSTRSIIRNKPQARHFDLKRTAAGGRLADRSTPVRALSWT